jgi:quinohemoprotein ethanol dehydrogenase
MKAAWMLHLGSGLSHGTPPYTLEATPIVQNGIMYMVTGADDVYALDAKTAPRSGSTVSRSRPAMR